jgi:hypothetical protein
LCTFLMHPARVLRSATTIRLRRFLTRSTMRLASRDVACSEIKRGCIAGVPRQWTTAAPCRPVRENAAGTTYPASTPGKSLTEKCLTNRLLPKSRTVCESGGNGSLALCLSIGACDRFATNLLPNTVQLHQLWCNKNTDEPTT